MPALTWDLLGPHVRKLEAMLRLYRPDQAFQPILAGSLEGSVWAAHFFEGTAELNAIVNENTAPRKKNPQAKNPPRCTPYDELVGLVYQLFTPHAAQYFGLAEATTPDVAGLPNLAQLRRIPAWQSAETAVGTVKREAQSTASVEPARLRRGGCDFILPRYEPSADFGSRSPSPEVVTAAWRELSRHFLDDLPPATLPTESSSLWTICNRKVHDLLEDTAYGGKPLRYHLLDTLVPDTAWSGEKAEQLLDKFGEYGREEGGPGQQPPAIPTRDQGLADWRAFVDTALMSSLDGAIRSLLPGKTDKTRSKRQTLKNSFCTAIDNWRQLFALSDGYDPLLSNTTVVGILALHNTLTVIKTECEAPETPLQTPSEWFDEIQTLPPTIVQEEILTSWENAVTGSESREVVVKSLVKLSQGRGSVTTTALADDATAHLMDFEKQRKRKTNDFGRCFRELSKAGLAFQGTAAWNPWAGKTKSSGKRVRSDRGWVINPLVLLIEPVARQFNEAVAAKTSTKKPAS